MEQMEAMLYNALYACLLYSVGYQVLKLVWIYWIHRPVNIVYPHVHYRTKVYTGPRNCYWTANCFWKMVHRCTMFTPGARNHHRGLQEGTQNMNIRESNL